MYRFQLRDSSGELHQYEGAHLRPSTSADVATTIERIFGEAVISGGLSLLEVLAPLVGRDPEAMTPEAVAGLLFRGVSDGGKIDTSKIAKSISGLLGHPEWPGLLPKLFDGVSRDGVRLVSPQVKGDPSLVAFDRAYLGNWDELKLAALMIVVRNRFLSGSGYFGDPLQSLIESWVDREEKPAND